MILRLIRPIWRPAPRRLGQAEAAAAAAVSPQQKAMELRRRGAIVEVEIATPGAYVQAARQEGQAAGGGVQRVKGLIDTGASITTVSDEIAQAAGLVQTSQVELGGVGGSSTRPIYAARVAIPAFGVTMDPIEVAGVSVPFTEVQMLIGRDLLAQAHLAYTGPQGVFSLTTKPPEGAPSGADDGGGGPTIPTAALIGGAVGAAALAVLFATDIL